MSFQSKIMPAARRFARFCAELADLTTLILLAALTAIGYGVEYQRPAFWIVGCLVYLPGVAVLLALNFRSRRS